MNNKKIKFLVIHDSEIPNVLNLKNLSENRFDICLRCFLACCTNFLDQEIPEISFVFSPSNLSHKMKYIIWKEKISNEDDEVSIAGKIRDSYDSFVKEDDFRNILQRDYYDLIVLLEESGNPFNTNIQKIINASNILFVLGAKNDVSIDLINIIKPHLSLNISAESMLASHVIILTRQLLYISTKM